jgi:hypothetical protein
MHPAIVWTAGGAGVFGAATASLFARRIVRRRLRPQLTAMREHLASCERTDAGLHGHATESASFGHCAELIPGQLIALDERRRQIAAAYPGLAAVLATIEYQAAQTVAASLADVEER